MMMIMYFYNFLLWVITKGVELVVAGHVVHIDPESVLADCGHSYTFDMYRRSKDKRRISMGGGNIVIANKSINLLDYYSYNILAYSPNLNNTEEVNAFKNELNMIQTYYNSHPINGYVPTVPSYQTLTACYTYASTSDFTALIQNIMTYIDPYQLILAPLVLDTASISDGIVFPIKFNDNAIANIIKSKRIPPSLWVIAAIENGNRNWEYVFKSTPEVAKFLVLRNGYATELTNLDQLLVTPTPSLYFCYGFTDIVDCDYLEW